MGIQKIVLGIFLLLPQVVNAHTDFLHPNHHHHNDGYVDMMNKGFDGLRHALSGPERRAAEERRRQEEVERQQLERERLRLERERLEFERQKEQRNNHTQQQSRIEQNPAYAQDWVNSISVLSYQGNVFANLSIPNDENGYKQVYFSYNQSTCTSTGAPAPNGIIFVNGSAIHTLGMCNANQTAITWAATKTEADIISEEFIRKKVVVVENAEKNSELVFSAKGFTKQWNKYQPSSLMNTYRYESEPKLVREERVGDKLICKYSNGRSLTYKSMVRNHCL